MKGNTMDKIELLCRAWIECDPDRRQYGPDETITLHGIAGVPRWQQHEPRALELLKFFEKHGYELRQTADKPEGLYRPSEYLDEVKKAFDKEARAEQIARDIIALAGGEKRVTANLGWSLRKIILEIIEGPESIDANAISEAYEDLGIQRSGSSPASPQDAAAMLGAIGGAEIGGDAAKGQITSREYKRQRDLQVLAEAHQIANERGQVVLASNIAHLFGELHLDTAA